VENVRHYAIKKGKEKGEINDQYTAQAQARFIMNATKGIRVSARITSDKKEYEDILHVVL